MTVIEMVEAKLKVLGADGLTEPNGDCACKKGDLALCDGYIRFSRPASSSSSRAS